MEYKSIRITKGKGALVAVALVALLTAAGSVLAQGTFPQRLVRIVTVSAAGSTGDMATRLVANKLGGTWNQSVLVENKPGGNLIPATDTVIKSPADGYTLLGTQGSMAQIPALRKLPYDTLRDLAPITKIMDTQIYYVVDSKLPVKNMNEFIAWARSNPGKYNFASYGTGSTAHLLAAMLNQDAKVDLIHVPYKGVPAAVQAVLGGEVVATLSDLGSVQPHVASGRLRILAATGTKRSIFSTDVPTFQEEGISGFSTSIWTGFFAPAGTPNAVLDKIAADVAGALATADVQAGFRKLTLEPSSNTPAEFRNLVRQEVEFWEKVIKQAGITVTD